MSLSERTWRDEATEEALRGFNNSEPLDALISAIRRAQPEVSTISLWGSRSGVLRFLHAECSDFEALFPGTHSMREEGTFSVYVDWVRVTWEGHLFEVTFEAGVVTGATVCIGPDFKALQRFAEAMEAFIERPEGRALRYSEGWRVAPDLDAEIGKVEWDDIILKPELRHELQHSVETFFANKEIMQSFGFAWKRGLLLVGPPGTGKTMICKAAATALPNLPFLYVRDLRERNQKESVQAIFKRARRLAPCLLVFEDLDSFINDTNRTIFLNEMDGFQPNDGILIIASCNHPGKIDEALLKRPSRFDRVFHIGLPELAERRAFCERLLTRESLAEKFAPDFDVARLCDEIARQTEGFTPAYLKEAFVAAALSRAQEGAMQLDDEFARVVKEQVQELRAHLKKAKNPDALAEMRSSEDGIGFRR